ncbi:hypothetical protein A2160_00445 [Candidatus Beckwithbacteria bacterium RBG_13_42_9]|uniref:Ribose-5-phosphate isomerase n=1 Tax=Candidatus Beckwithbacteria bacterium RBG_13_42_9 TaxID=1797457 RepID=A0A1F5E3X7_9BACT|nr:MAG: hypothetical protein A2160_00445 [Candidatus Beckwithbacteria bacterium RBG_13_42_9]
MNLFLGSDHRGFKLKEKLKEWLGQKKIDFVDLGPEKFDPEDDYPDMAQKLALKIVDEKSRGILLCGSGAGMEIAANKVKGIRAAIGFNPQQVRKMVEDDDVNILCLAADYISKFKAFQLTKIFLNSQFINKGKYLRRVEKIKKLEI